MTDDTRAEALRIARATVDDADQGIYIAPHRTLLARALIEAHEYPGLVPGRFVCPECGPRVRGDEDGCCALCGAECRLSDELTLMIGERDALRAAVATLTAERDEARATRDRLERAHAEAVFGKAEMKRERDVWKCRADSAHADGVEAYAEVVTERDEARREVERMRPVVAEAERMVDNYLVSGISYLAKVVGDYRASAPIVDATTHGRGEGTGR